MSEGGSTIIWIEQRIQRVNLRNRIQGRNFEKRLRKDANERPQGLGKMLGALRHEDEIWRATQNSFDADSKSRPSRVMERVFGARQLK